jgi:hypothetical protein
VLLVIIIIIVPIIIVIIVVILVMVLIIVVVVLVVLIIMLWLVLFCRCTLGFLSLMCHNLNLEGLLLLRNVLRRVMLLLLLRCHIQCSCGLCGKDEPSKIWK